MKVFKNEGKFFMEDNENVVELTPDAGYYLRLPVNSTGRQFASCKKIDNAPNQTIDYGTTVKIPKVLGPQAPKKPLEEYLNENDKKTYLALVEKAKKAREEANKKIPLTDLEKARKQVEKWAARVAELEKK